MKDAYNKSTFTMRERMEELTSGLELPVKSVRGQSGVRRAEGLFILPAPSAPQLSLTPERQFAQRRDLRTQLAP